MAHNLHYSQKLGRHAAIYANHPAWHKFGEVKDGLMTISDVLNGTDMDYPMEVRELEHDGKKTGIFGVCRSDNNTFFAACSGKYTPITPKESFEVVDVVLKNINGAHYNAAGQIGNGSRFWACAVIGDGFTIGNGDKHETMLNVLGSHDGSSPLIFKLWSRRVECENMYMMALRSHGKEVKIRHTKNAKAILEQAKQILSGAEETTNELYERMDMLAKREVTKEHMIDIMEKLFPVSDEAKRTTRRDGLVAEVLKCYQNNDGNAYPEIAGTAYNLLNAIVEYTDHLRGVRQTSGRDGLSVDNIRAENALFGTGADFKENAFEIIYEAAQSMPYKGIVGRAIAKGEAMRAAEAPQIEAPSLLDSILDM